MVVQPAQDRQAENASGSLNGPRYRRVLFNDRYVRVSL